MINKCLTDNGWGAEERGGSEERNMVEGSGGKGEVGCYRGVRRKEARRWTVRELVRH